MMRRYRCKVCKKPCKSNNKRRVTCSHKCSVEWQYNVIRQYAKYYRRKAKLRRSKK